MSIKKRMDEISKELNAIAKEHDCMLFIDSKFQRNLTWEGENDIVDTLNITVTSYSSEDDETEVANMTLLFVPSNVSNEYIEDGDFDTFTVADDYSADLGNACSNLTSIFWKEKEAASIEASNLVEDIVYSSNIVYLERLWIHKDFRNEGLASLLLKNIFWFTNRATGFMPYGITLIPAPYEHQGLATWEEEKLKLINFYKKFNAILLCDDVYCLKNVESEK